MNKNSAATCEHAWQKCFQQNQRCDGIGLNHLSQQIHRHIGEKIIDPRALINSVGNQSVNASEFCESNLGGRCDALLISQIQCHGNGPNTHRATLKRHLTHRARQSLASQWIIHRGPRKCCTAIQRAGRQNEVMTLLGKGHRNCFADSTTCPSHHHHTLFGDRLCFNHVLHCTVAQWVNR